MFKRFITIGIACALFLSLIPTEVSAAKGTVQVKIANFPVKVNGQLINNRLAKNPFIVYKDITYIPMSWEMFTELELSASWSKAKGLQVYRDPVYGSKAVSKKKPYPQNQTVKNSTSSTYSAKISTNKIEIAYEKISNDKEPYPFLEFRNVTYMPLTWKFAHTKLMIDLQWNKTDGLSLWGGQDKLLGDIIYDDEDALYLNTGIQTKDQRILKVSKSLKTPPEWIDKEQENAIFDKINQAMLAPLDGGKPVTVELVGSMLTYQGLELETMPASEKYDEDVYPLQIESILYDVDEKRKVLYVKTFYATPFAHIHYDPNSYHLFALVDGKVEKITDQSYHYLPPRILKNADGTVWIAHDRIMGPYGFYIPGTGSLVIMDQDGTVHLANDLWNEQDVSPIGLNSSISDQSQMIVRLYGKPKWDKNGNTIYDSGFIDSYLAEKDALFTVNTSLGLKRLPNAPDSKDDLVMYKDIQGDVYSLNLYSNTLTNWTKNQFKTWSDAELLKGLTKGQ
jgi:hypothetical protein